MMGIRINGELIVPLPKELSDELSGLPSNHRVEDKTLHSFDRRGVSEAAAKAYVRIWEMWRAEDHITPPMRQLVARHLRGLSLLASMIPYEPLYSLCVQHLARELRRRSSYQIAEMLGLDPLPFTVVL